MSETYDGATTALQRQVAELTAELAQERDTVKANQHAADREYKRRLAAESALASARKALQRAHDELDGTWPRDRIILVNEIREHIREALSSHPEPSSDLASERSKSSPAPVTHEPDFVQCPKCNHLFPCPEDPVASPCAGCEELRSRLEVCEMEYTAVKTDYDACHRQHEQCMKLLEKCDYFLQTYGLPADGETRSLIRTMLSNGELPQG